MQYIPKPFARLSGPKDLNRRRKKFLVLLRKNKIHNSFRKTICESKAKEIFKFYNAHKKNDELGFNTYKTRFKLLKSSKYRCAFCGRYIQPSNEVDPNYKKLTIEHFEEECRHPLKILEWGNLFPSCEECNGNRKNKIINFSSPSSLRFRKNLSSLVFSYDGYVQCKNKSLNTYLTAYNLNSVNLRIERSRFYMQMINPNFRILLKLEKEELGKVKKAILFWDEYLSVSKNVCKVKTYKNKLLDIAKEVLSNA